MLAEEGVERQTWEAALAAAKPEKHSEWHYKDTPDSLAKLTTLWSSWIRFVCQPEEDDWPLPTARNRRDKEERWLRAIGRGPGQEGRATEARHNESKDTCAQRKHPERAGPGKGPGNV